MLKRHWTLIKFVVKYHYKHYLMFLIIALVIVGFIENEKLSKINVFKEEKNFTEMNIIDNDNTAKSREYLDYLNLKHSNKEISKITIPKGFEENLTKNKTVNILFSDINNNDLTKYTIKSLNYEVGKNKIKLKKEDGILPPYYILFFVIYISLDFAKSIFYDKQGGKIKYFSNFYNYWIYFVLVQLGWLIILLASLSTYPILSIIVIELMLLNLLWVLNQSPTPQTENRIFMINAVLIAIFWYLQIEGFIWLPALNVIYHNLNPLWWVLLSNGFIILVLFYLLIKKTKKVTE